MAPVEALPVPSAALRLESMLEMAAQSEPRASAAPLPAPAAVETPTVHGAGAGQADPLRSIPALPAPLIDRILCFCTLRDFPRLALANKAVARAARQPHVLAELFRNTYHPSLALLKALELLPDFDLALAQCFTKWYMPLPRYVLHWLRVDRHGLAYSDMSDEDTVISSPTTPGHCRIAKDVYMYLMTQGYCRYVKPEANRFDVGEDDLYSFVYQISELADARSDKETKMYLHEIWDLVTSCHPPLMLLPERIAEAPDDIVRNIFHLWYECQVQRYETFRVVIEAGFDFVAYNRGWQQGRDAWNRFFLRELDELGNDPDDEDFLRLREDYIPFARLLVNLGCHIHRWVVIRMISMLVTSGRDSRNSILYAIEVGRRSQSLEFQEPGEAAYMFLQCISDFSVSTTANLRILIECHVPLADVAIKTIDRLFRHGRIPDFNLMYRLSKAAELLKPNVNRTWQQAAQHVYQNRDPEVVAAEQRAVQAGGDDQARLNAGFMAAKALASQRMDLIFHQAMQVHIARVDPALPMLQTSITRSHVCAPDVVSYITRWTKTNPQYYMPILQHFVADPVIHGPFMNAVKKNYIWEVERQHRQQLQQSGLQNAPQLELKVEDVSDEVAIDYLNQKIRLG